MIKSFGIPIQSCSVVTSLAGISPLPEITLKANPF